PVPIFISTINLLPNLAVQQLEHRLTLPSFKLAVDSRFNDLGRPRLSSTSRIGTAPDQPNIEHFPINGKFAPVRTDDDCWVVLIHVLVLVLYLPDCAVRELEYLTVVSHERSGANYRALVAGLRLWWTCEGEQQQNANRASKRH